MGRLTTYSDLAARAGAPKAARAVGAAVGKNPICFVVPCHRVIGKSGELTGYHWGSDAQARHARLGSGHGGGLAVIPETARSAVVRNPDANSEFVSGFRARRYSASKTRVNALMAAPRNDDNDYAAKSSFDATVESALSR